MVEGLVTSLSWRRPSNSGPAILAFFAKDTNEVRLSSVAEFLLISDIRFSAEPGHPSLFPTVIPSSPTVALPKP